jgi:hypothetical protein
MPFSSEINAVLLLYYRNRSALWLVGIGLFGYLFVSSLVVLWRRHHKA